MRRYQLNRARRRGGQTLVEFALTVSLLMMVTLLTIQFGILFNCTLVLTHLAREGARNAAVHCLEASNQNYSDADIKTYIRSRANGSSIRILDSNITISPAPNSAERRSSYPITIAVTYNLNSKVFLPRMAGVSRLMRNYTATSVQVIE